MSEKKTPFSIRTRLLMLKTKHKTYQTFTGARILPSVMIDDNILETNRQNLDIVF